MAAPVIPLIKYLLTLFRGARGTVGAVETYAGDTPPPEWFECDGRALSSTDYPDLYNVIQQRYGDGTAGLGATGSTDFNLPDLRGRFVRGYDNGATNDPDAVGRGASGIGGTAIGDAVGSYQPDEIGPHIHSTSGAGAGSSGGDGNTQTSGSRLTSSTSSNTSNPALGVYGTETRPTNISLMYIIKY